MTQFFINLVTYWILYSYLVPISLFVTMEIVKFWQVRALFHIVFGSISAILSRHLSGAHLAFQRCVNDVRRGQGSRRLA